MTLLPGYSCIVHVLQKADLLSMDSHYLQFFFFTLFKMATHSSLGKLLSNLFEANIYFLFKENMQKCSRFKLDIDLVLMSTITNTVLF